MKSYIELIELLIKARKEITEASSIEEMYRNYRVFRTWARVEMTYCNSMEQKTFASFVDELKVSKRIAIDEFYRNEV